MQFIGSEQGKSRTSNLDALLREHEIKTNLVMSFVFVALAALSFVVLLLLRFSVITFDYSSWHMCYHCIIVCFMTAVALVIIATRGEHRFDKHLIVFSLIVLALVANAYYVSAYLVYFIPLAVCVAYHDRKLTVYASVSTLAVAAFGVCLSVWCGTIDLNNVNLEAVDSDEIMITSTAEEIIVNTLCSSYSVFAPMFIVASAVSYVTTSTGIRIMEQKAAADQRESALEKELNLASEIQKGMVPADSFDDEHYRITASMKTAKIVGGDYYDYFMTDESHIAILIADVSGKGVPASLFMASAKTMMHSFAMRGQSPADMLDSVNRSLCESNPEKMFVTAWVGILDLETGRLAYANAGHNPPIILRDDGTVGMIECRPNFILGNRKNIRYQDHHADICIGDRIILYTDGVTEAMDRNGNMYTLERLMETLSMRNTEQSAEIIESIHDSVDTFADDAEQSDDMTLLILDYRKRYICEDEPGKTFTVGKETYPSMISYIRDELKSKGCLDKMITDFEICASEVLSNIDMYAYSGSGEGKVMISANVKNRRVRVVFSDYGPEYNPLEHTNPDSEKRISEHKIGGFGILVVKKMMDDVIYERKDGMNVLTLKKEF